MEQRRGKVTADAALDILQKSSTGGEEEVKEHSGAVSTLRGILRPGGSGMGRKGASVSPCYPLASLLQLPSDVR